MADSILGERDKLTPLRLLSLMPDWAEQGHFEQIWGPDLGTHFWRKFTVERKRNVTNFVLELDAKPEAQLWHFLMRMSVQKTPETVSLPRTFMIFYRRNHAGMPIEFVSLPCIALTHEYICNVSAGSPLEAMYDMHPDTWDLDYDQRVQYNQIVWRKEIAAGDILLEYNDRQIKNGWMVKCNENEGLHLESLPPW